MKILAFDTSTRGISLAVADNQTILRRRNPKSQFLSSSIMPAIQSILKSCGLTLKSMDGIIIGLGPGSFTSLRVGIATAQALTFAHKIPAVGLSSLDTIAMNVKVDGTICVMNDARRGLVYACVYEKRNSSLKRLTDYSLDTPEALVENLDSSMMVIGDAVPLYRTLLLQPYKFPVDFYLINMAENGCMCWAHCWLLFRH